MTDNAENKPKALVIGIGNEHRADDAFGLFVARRLRGLLPSPTTILEHHGEGASLMEAWSGYSLVILVDAVRSGTAPGTIFRFEASAGKIPAKFFHYSTHEFGIAEAVEMARVLGQLPSKLLIYGVEGANFGFGEPVSKEVEVQIPIVAESIFREFTSPAQQ